MTGGQVKGWCPSAYRPMVSGDGLLVRVRPYAGRLSVDEAVLLADLALRFGNGMIDLTSRANLQIRGVTEDGFRSLLKALQDEGLVDENPDVEERRSIVVAPHWSVGGVAERLVESLTSILLDLPDLPDKMGFAVDVEAEPVLQNVSADVRFERGASGDLIMVADGAKTGCVVTEKTAADAALALLDWFVVSGGVANKRMSRHLQCTLLPNQWLGAERHGPQAPIQPGDSPMGPVFGVPFGAVMAEDLIALIAASGPSFVRVTPWRSLILEGARLADVSGFVTTANAPLMAVSACPGRPACASANVQTRDVARRLAGRTGGSLHVSGCDKGCARPKAADVTLVGRDGRFDLVQGGSAGDTPVLRGLAVEELTELFS